MRLKLNFSSARALSMLYPVSCLLERRTCTESREKKSRDFVNHRRQKKTRDWLQKSREFWDLHRRKISRFTFLEKRKSRENLFVWRPLRPIIQIKILRFTFLKKRKSWDFFTHTNQKSQEKKSQDFWGSPRKIFLWGSSRDFSRDFRFSRFTFLPKLP